MCTAVIDSPCMRQKTDSCDTGQNWCDPGDITHVTPSRKKSKAAIADAAEIWSSESGLSSYADKAGSPVA